MVVKQNHMLSLFLNTVLSGYFSRISTLSSNCCHHSKYYVVVEKRGSEGELLSSEWDWDELMWMATKPVPSSASHRFCSRLFGWSQEFLRDLPVCEGRTWVWDHIEIPGLDTICQASAHMPLFSFAQAFLLFVDRFIHFCAACTAQVQPLINTLWIMTMQSMGHLLYLTKMFFM